MSVFHFLMVAALIVGSLHNAMLIDIQGRLSLNSVLFALSYVRCERLARVSSVQEKVAAAAGGLISTSAKEERAAAAASRLIGTSALLKACSSDYRRSGLALHCTCLCLSR